MSGGNSPLPYFLLRDHPSQPLSWTRAWLWLVRKPRPAAGPLPESPRFTLLPVSLALFSNSGVTTTHGCFLSVSIWSGCLHPFNLIVIGPLMCHTVLETWQKSNSYVFQLFPFTLEELGLTVNYGSHTAGKVAEWGHKPRFVLPEHVLFSLPQVSVQGGVVWVTDTICASLRGSLPLVRQTLTFGGEGEKTCFKTHFFWKWIYRCSK